MMSAMKTVGSIITEDIVEIYLRIATISIVYYCSSICVHTVPLKGKVALLSTFLLATRYSTHLSRMSLKHGKWLLRDKIL